LSKKWFMMESLNNISEVIRNNDFFLIASHENPDGDAIGSMAAFGHLLKTMGKNFSIFNQSEIPDKFKWVNMPARVQNQYHPGRYSWIIVLDCGNFQRSGKELFSKAAEPIINIDHHRGNPDFGQINWVDISFSCVGEMVAELADHMNIVINGPIAQGIYLALVSDTGYFSFGNTSARVHELCARLIRNGVNPGEINARILGQWTIERLKLHGMAMQKTLLLSKGRVGVISVSRQMLNEAGARPDDCEGLVNAVRNIKGVQVAISLREDGMGNTKFSLRSTGNINVQLMAAELEGGGHKNASGGTIQADMDKARDLIMEVVTRHLDA
jgi:bifunctional oligoribonuclease and PAP phosphatase NrnA